jgi:ureidoglycolate dehydrogenase (NAD+)
MTKRTRILLEPEPLLRFVCDTLAGAGVASSVAEATGRGLWSTSMRGTDSHGVRLLPHYVAGVEAGRLNPTPQMTFEKTAPGGGIVDADHSFGHAAGMMAMEHAIGLAEVSGAGFVAVRNSSHCGAMAYFGLEAARRDMIGLAFTHATPKMRSPQSTRPFFGTNPLCFTAPMADEEPFCFDAAPTPFPNNKVKQYREDEQPLPAGVAADVAGEETLDAARAVQLLPIGDYKGFGLAMVADILCALLSGMPAGSKVSSMYENALTEKRYLGQFFGAIRIDMFEDPGVFKRRLRETADGLRSEPQRDPALPNMVPGDPEKRAWRERSARGVPITEGDFRKFRELSEKLGVNLPASMEAQK